MIDTVTTLGVVVMLLLQASAGSTGSVQSWVVFAKLLVGLGVALLIVSGGLFALAWSVAQKARGQWFSLATEWSMSKSFRDVWLGLAEDWAESDNFRVSVNAARKDLQDRLITEMHAEIDRRIAVHNSSDNEYAHRGAIMHVFRNMATDLIGKYGFERQIRDLEERIDELEKKR